MITEKAKLPSIKDTGRLLVEPQEIVFMDFKKN